MGIGLAPVCRAEHDIAIGHGLGGFLDAGVLQEPLHAQTRFNRYIGTLGDTHVVLVVLYFFKKSFGFDELDGFVAGFKALQTMQFRAARAVDVTIGGEYINDFEIVLHAHLKVGAVVGGGYLESSGTELDFHVVIGNDGDFGLTERADNRFADKVGEARVFRIHRHGHVCHDGFRAGGRHQELAAAICQFVTDGV